MEDKVLVCATEFEDVDNKGLYDTPTTKHTIKRKRQSPGSSFVTSLLASLAELSTRRLVTIERPLKLWVVAGLDSADGEIGRRVTIDT